MLLVLHPKMLPPQEGQDFGFLRAMLAPFGVKYKATLWLRWCHLGDNFGDFGAVLKAIWDHFQPCCFGIVKNNPKIHLRNALPPGPEGETESNQKPSQNIKTPPKC